MEHSCRIEWVTGAFLGRRGKLRAECSCGWKGPNRDTTVGAKRDRTEHYRNNLKSLLAQGMGMPHKGANEAIRWCTVDEESKMRVVVNRKQSPVTSIEVIDGTWVLSARPVEDNRWRVGIGSGPQSGCYYDDHEFEITADALLGWANAIARELGPVVSD